MSAVAVTAAGDRVAVLTIDQPGSKANVLSPALWADLAAALDEAAAMRPNGLVLTSAKPGIFIAGADLNVIRAATAPNDPAVRQLIEQGHAVLNQLESFPAPTAAFIDGAALGGGLEVALACDLRFVGPHPKCRLGLPEVHLGLIPGWGGTQRLPRLIGLVKAGDMLATGNSLSADESAESGLATRAESIDAVVASWSTRTATAPANRDSKQRPIADRDAYRPAISDRPVAVRTALQTMESGAGQPLDAALAIELDAFMAIAGSESSRPLVEAFFTRSGK